jgi:hypothetical protein
LQARHARGGVILVYPVIELLEEVLVFLLPLSAAKRSGCGLQELKR